MPLRYNVIVAAVYFALFLTVGVLAGGLNHRSMELLLMPLMGGGLGVLATIAAVARFGHLGGSTYFAATVLHVALVCAGVFALALSVR